MNCDFDQRVRELVHGAADALPPDVDLAARIEQATVRATHQPTPGTHSSPRPRRRWLLPVLASAAVLAVAIAVTLAATRDRSNDHTPPATIAPTVTLSHSHTPTPAPTSPSTPVQSGPPAATHLVTLGGARVLLPKTWVARPILGSRTPEWCLLPASQTMPSSPDCPAIRFSPIPARSTGWQVSVDTTGGMISNPQWCGPGNPPTKQQLLDYGDKTFGGRTADYRRWLFACTDGTTWPVEQYVVDNGPGYIIFSAKADATVHAVIDRMAAGSTLPNATTPLRYSDFGLIRSSAHEADGFHITVDRVVQDIGTLINNNPTTYPYVVPDTAVQSRRALTVGQLVELTTDGHQVTWLNVVG